MAGLEQEEDYRRAASVLAEMTEMEAGDRVACLERLMQQAEHSQDWPTAGTCTQSPCFTLTKSANTDAQKLCWQHESSKSLWVSTPAL